MDLAAYQLEPMQLVYVVLGSAGLFLLAWIAGSLIGGGPRE